MRIGVLWGIVIAVAAAALGWGALVGTDPVPARPADQTAAVDSAWYQALSLDPVQATEAYLARIPTEMRARGEVVSDARLFGFGLRLLTLIAATIAICAAGFAAGMRRLAQSVSQRPLVVDTLVALQYFVALYALNLPVEVYARFVLSHRFGFSDQAFLSWLADDLVNWAVITCFYVVGMLLTFRIIRSRPATWAAWAVVVYFVLRALYAFAEPGVIEPLTNSFRPLADGPQKLQILALAHANGIIDASVVVSDASRQTRLLNAHVSGFGSTARIVVDDSTLAKTRDPMLRMVVAHEIGHFVLGHVIASVVSDTLIAAVGFAFVALGLRLIVPRFGPAWGLSGSGDIATLPLFWGLFLLWGFLSLPLANAVSRVYEHQADMFGLNASREPHGMAEFMIHDADTSRLSPSTLEYALFYNHPSDAQRVATAMQWRAAMQGTTP
ncbi:MAG TPA: M48 family metalloprotease [Caldimonas sp.]|jgi:STE24 endopeptidase